jgi:hypothetical protein
MVFIVIVSTPITKSITTSTKIANRMYSSSRINANETGPGLERHIADQSSSDVSSGEYSVYPVKKQVVDRKRSERVGQSARSPSRVQHFS